ncbi:MAG: EFR1 family ferrodoxin [Muribaculaceae bacterium]
MIFYFSGTGNTAYVAQQLANQLGERLVHVGKAMAQGELQFTLQPGESVGWVFPTYSWGPAPIVANMAQSITLHGYSQDTYCYVVATCGDEVGETVSIMRRALMRSGICLQAAFSVQMPNNYILLPGFDVDSTEVEHGKRQAAPQRIAQVAQSIEQHLNVCDVVVGPWPRLKSRIIYPLFKRFYMSDKPFRADPQLCTHCKLCANVCPVGNITITPQGEPQWHNHCAMCLSCIHRCPARAINYGSITRNKGRYHF